MKLYTWGKGKTHNAYERIRRKIGDTFESKVIRACLSRKEHEKGRVLFWTDSGMFDLFRLHVGLAFALAVRGYSPHFILCDQSCQGACILSTDPGASSLSQKALCQDCMARHKKLLDKFHFSYSFVSELLGPVQQRQIEQLCRTSRELVEKDSLFGLQLDGIEIGKDIADTLIRRNRNASSVCFSCDEAELYGRMAGTTMLAFKQAVNCIHPSHLFIPHAQYAFARPAARVAQAMGRPFFSYLSHHCGGLAYKTIFPRDICTSPFAVNEATWDAVQKLPVTGKINESIISFFKERYEDFEHLDSAARSLAKPGRKLRELRTKFELDGIKPIYAIFTHITWDNTLGYGNTPFTTFDEWLDFTLRVIRDVDQTQWLIKIHPDELLSKRNRSTYGASAYIKKFFPDLPPHITIIPPDACVSPYDFFKILDGVVTCSGTSGLEAAVLGKNVINAAAGYYSCKGFTLDPVLQGNNNAEKKEAYASLLRQSPYLPKPSPEQILDAKKFFYLFFIRKNIPITVFDKRTFAINRPLDWCRLLRGRDKYIELICNGIIKKEDILLEDMA